MSKEAREREVQKKDIPTDHLSLCTSCRPVRRVLCRLSVHAASPQAAGVSWMTVRRYFVSGTMTISCFFVRNRRSRSSSYSTLVTLSSTASHGTESRWTNLFVHFLYQLVRRRDKIPDHSGKVLDPPGLAFLRGGHLVGKGRGRRGVAGLGRSEGRHVAARLEDGATDTIEDDAGLDARLLQQPAQLLFEGVIAVGPVRLATESALWREQPHRGGSRPWTSQPWRTLPVCEAALLRRTEQGGGVAARRYHLKCRGMYEVHASTLTCWGGAADTRQRGSFLPRDTAASLRPTCTYICM